MLIGLVCAGFRLYSQTQTAPAPGEQRILYFSKTDSPEGIREISNAIRAITDIPAVPDTAQRTLQLTGTANQIELAEWVFGELDRPVAGDSPSELITYHDQLPNGKAITDIVQVLYFPNPATPVRIQQTVNTMRAIAEIVRLMPVNGISAIVLRGSADRATLAQWIFNQLAQPAPAQKPGVYEYRLPGTGFAPDDVTRVFYLSTNNLQPIISAVRDATKITGIMPNEVNAVVARGTDRQISAASQLILQLDHSSPQQ